MHVWQLAWTEQPNMQLSMDCACQCAQSTSGVKARAASGADQPQLGGGSAGTAGRPGAADREEQRFEKEAAVDQTPAKSGNQGFRV